VSAIDAIAAVTARLQTIEALGPNVFDMVRNAVTDADLYKLFVVTQGQKRQVLAWQVTRKATAPKDEALSAMSRTHRIEITGYMSFQDGITEPIFQQLIEYLCAAFDSYADGSARRRFVSEQYPYGQFDWSGPMEVADVGHAMLRDILVHRTQLFYPIREYPL
jgi:hypothetical protein